MCSFRSTFFALGHVINYSKERNRKHSEENSGINSDNLFDIFTGGWCYVYILISTIAK